jgi:hypothetical protein
MDDMACAGIVPTRSRPEQAARLIDAWAGTATCSDLIFCLDEDDPLLPAYQELEQRSALSVGRICWLKGARQSLTGWTNTVAERVCGRYEALVSLGDDHVPATPGWDRTLLEAARLTGGGLAYGDDGLQHENLPTAALITTNAIAALRWMAYPRCKHMYIDAVWRDLFECAGRRTYRPDVHIEHWHHTARRSMFDATYAAGQASWLDDEAAYHAWLAAPAASPGLTRDAATVRLACGGDR